MELWVIIVSWRSRTLTLGFSEIFEIAQTLARPIAQARVALGAAAAQQQQPFAMQGLPQHRRVRLKLAA